jgi:hypothetical protein
LSKYRGQLLHNGTIIFVSESTLFKVAVSWVLFTVSVEVFLQELQYNKTIAKGKIDNFIVIILA